MTLPLLPELSVIDFPLHEMQQRLLALRQSLDQACRELDEQLAALGVAMPVSSPHVNASRSSNGSLRAEPAPNGARRLFEAPPSVLSQPQKSFSDDSWECSKRVIEAMSSPHLDPLMEQATLEELNSALSEAFAQIAMKREW